MSAEEDQSQCPAADVVIGHEHEQHGTAHAHSHNAGHSHNHDDAGHSHSHDDAGHSHSEQGHSHHAHGQGHSHRPGLSGFLHGLFVPHSHDAADSIDDALEASTHGIRALNISLVILLVTTVLQFLVFLVSGSVALLADTIHNFSDALTAVPLWIAFILGRRAATSRYTFGFGRAEDLAGLFIVAVVALSAVVAAWESIRRLLDPQPLDNLGFVIAAGLIGFAGNEIVAGYRIRVGRRIGSAALVADGVHARLDGFTSLAVVLGAVGVMIGFPLADPIVGIVISAVIVVLLWGTVRSIGRRLMDGIEPELIDRARQALEATPGVAAVPRLQLRWVGHRLQGVATVLVSDAPLSAIDQVVQAADHNLRHALPNLDQIAIRPTVGATG